VQVFDLGVASGIVSVGSHGWYSVKLKLPGGQLGTIIGDGLKAALPLVQEALEPLGGWVSGSAARSGLRVRTCFFAEI
jgi:hypothetical protein